MKKSFLFLLSTAALFLTVSPAIAQEDNQPATQSENYLKMDAENDTIEPDSTDQLHPRKNPFTGDYKNIAKINLTSLAFTTFSLQYERLLPHKMSVALGIKFRPNTALPLKNQINNLVIGDEEDKELTTFLESTKINSFVITPEFRYYFGKTAGKGFYLAPFLRYEHYNLSSTFTFTDMNDMKTNVPFKGSMENIGIGLLIGSQFKIGERFTLDWWILGPYYSFSSKLNLKASGFNFQPEDQEILQESLEDLEISWFKTESKVTATSANLTMKGKLGGIRAFGLCFGFKF